DPRLPYRHRDPWFPSADGPQRWTLTPARPMIWTGGIDCTTCRRRRNGRLNKGTEHSMTEWRTSEADVAAILAARHPDSFTSTAVGRNAQIVAAPNSVGPVESTRSRQSPRIRGLWLATDKRIEHCELTLECFDGPECQAFKSRPNGGATCSRPSRAGSSRLHTDGRAIEANLVVRFLIYRGAS